MYDDIVSTHEKTVQRTVPNKEVDTLLKNRDDDEIEEEEKFVAAQGEGSVNVFATGEEDEDVEQMAHSHSHDVNVNDVPVPRGVKRARSIAPTPSASRRVAGEALGLARRVTKKIFLGLAFTSSDVPFLH